MTLDQKSLGSSPSRAALKSLRIIYSQAFLFYAGVKIPMISDFYCMDFCMDTANTVDMNSSLRKFRYTTPLKLKDEFIIHFAASSWS